MPTPHPTRREFLQKSARGLGVLAVTHYASTFLLSSAFAGTAPDPAAPRTLVLVQLAGGNDGLNTVIPFEDASYHRLRPTLAFAKSEILPLNDLLGLHPACRGLHSLFQEGKLTVVQGAGSIQPSLSHARSIANWALQSSVNDTPTGWLGRYLDSLTEISLSGAASPGLYFGDARPLCLQSADESRATGFDRDVRLQALAHARRAAGDYPDDGFGAALRNLAALIAANAAPRIAVVTLDGFDTHANQAHSHTNRLRLLSAGLTAFQRDLEARDLDRRVLTLACSEFGRSPAENENRGTGHGTAAPVFLLGPALQGGLVGESPALPARTAGQLATGTDFRKIYATVLEDWLGSTAEPLLGGEFGKLDLLTATTVTQRGA